MMKIAGLFALFAASVFGAPPAPSSTSGVEVNQACAKACQVAPEDQRDTCMRVCSQFAEQGISFSPATATASRSSASAAAKPSSPAARSGTKTGSAAMSKASASANARA
ncbi:hypothetical protein GGH92_009565, partial [Coemansia sp. RSA 2673]